MNLAERTNFRKFARSFNARQIQVSTKFVRISNTMHILCRKPHLLLLLLYIASCNPKLVKFDIDDHNLQWYEHAPNL